MRLDVDDQKMDENMILDISEENYTDGNYPEEEVKETVEIEAEEVALDKATTDDAE